MAGLLKWEVQMGEVTGWSNDKLQYELKLNIVIWGECQTVWNAPLICWFEFGSYEWNPPFILDILKHNLFTVQLKEIKNKLEGLSNGLMCIACISDVCFVDIVAAFQLEVI